MSDIEGKATIELRVVGPLDGDESPPLGATAWISAGDDEPVVVSIPIGEFRDPATVEVSAGRVVVVLRVPSGRRGRREFVLNAGQVQSIEFGKAKPQQHVIITSPNVIDPLKIPGVDTNKPPATPIDPMKIEQWHPPVVTPRDRPLGGLPKDPGGAWMSQIDNVVVISQPRPGGHFEQCTVRKNAIPNELYSYESSATRLELGMAGCFAFVVFPTEPHKDKVLLHRAAWTHQIARFTVELRNDATTIPIDSEVFLADEKVMPLLSFLASGDIPSARAMGARFAEAAGGYLSRKFTNHHLAVVGAYALHALRETAMYENWIRTLYKHFEDTSDGAILYAMHLMRARPGGVSEWYDEARTALVEAAKRPIPLLTTGVYLLVEGLERLSSSRRAAGDVKLEQALRRALWIQARARPDEIFTALWMDRRDLPDALLPHVFSEISGNG